MGYNKRVPVTIELSAADYDVIEEVFNLAAESVGRYKSHWMQLRHRIMVGCSHSRLAVHVALKAADGDE